MDFKIYSNYQPAGDQPNAIRQLTEGLNLGYAYQTLLGVTGSGKTFTMAHVVETLQRPTMILAPNKTLAAQLYGEMHLISPKMRWNISFLITIIINPKPMCHRAIPISQKMPL